MTLWLQEEKDKMAKRRYVRKKSKYEDDAIFYETEIQKIDFLNQEIKERYKSVFYVKSSLLPEGKMCVYWGNCNLQVGDRVVLKGRISGDVFLIWSYQIYQRANQPTEENV